MKGITARHITKPKLKRKRLCAQRPLIMVIGELHWADDVLLTFVDRLLERFAFGSNRDALDRHGRAGADDGVLRSGNPKIKGGGILLEKA